MYIKRKIHKQAGIHHYIFISCGSYFEIMLHEANLWYIVFTKAARTICCFPFLDWCFKCC